MEMTPAAQSRPGARRYLLTWLTLLALATTTFGLAHLDLGPARVPTALAIAGAKATLIVLFFMGLSRERGSIPIAVGLWLALLIILVALTAADVATRW